MYVCPWHTHKIKGGFLNHGQLLSPSDRGYFNFGTKGLAPLHGLLVTVYSVHPLRAAGMDRGEEKWGAATERMG